jgi:teichuronic acid biosynthesis glycosyltransferase TuaH
MNTQDIVFFTVFRTDNAYSSISLSMSKVLAKECRVFYVNHPYSIWEMWQKWRAGDQMVRERMPWLLSGRIRYEHFEKIPEHFISVVPPLIFPTNFLPKGPIYRFFHGINNRIVLRTIRKTLQRYQVKNFVYINCFDPYYAGCLPKSMGASKCIYHCIDDTAEEPFTLKHAFELENQAIREADITFVTSTKLAKLKAPLSDRIVSYFNAADVQIFERVTTEKFERPPELQGREGKVIGYTGNLDILRVDYPLLQKIARANPDKTLLLVGPYRSDDYPKFGLDQLPNVLMIGSRPIEQLPAYLQHMDCVLIPFALNKLTESIYPLKINEYLAAGKPVVSSSFSDDIRSFAPYIYLAENHDHFLTQIDHALAEQAPDLIKKRQAMARTNTWEARIRQLWEIVGGK